MSYISFDPNSVTTVKVLRAIGVPEDIIESGRFYTEDMVALGGSVDAFEKVARLDEDISGSGGITISELEAQWLENVIAKNGNRVLSMFWSDTCSKRSRNWFDHYFYADDTAIKRAVFERSMNYTDSAHPGDHTRSSPIVGSRFMELSEALLLSEEYPEITRFSETIHPLAQLLIPEEDYDAAEKMASQIYEDYVGKYRRCGASADNVVAFIDTDQPVEVVTTFDSELWQNTWHVHASVGKYGARALGMRIPASIAALHELMHVEETEKGAPVDTGGWALSKVYELMPTINTIVVLDEIYKKIHGIDIEAEVDHGKVIDWRTQRADVGKIANFYRRLKNEKGSIGAAVISPESVAFIQGRPL